MLEVAEKSLSQKTYLFTIQCHSLLNFLFCCCAEDLHVFSFQYGLNSCWNAGALNFSIDMIHRCGAEFITSCSRKNVITLDQSSRCSSILCINISRQSYRVTAIRFKEREVRMVPFNCFYRPPLTVIRGEWRTILLYETIYSRQRNPLPVISVIMFLTLATCSSHC